MLMTRNLLFHLYPKRKTFWRWHVEQLIRFRDVWNGKKIIVVVEDDHTEPWQDVFEALSPVDALVYFKRNTPELGEVKYFIPMLRLLESLDPNEATFYAHAKGVSHDSMLAQIQMWSKAMYELNLSFPEIVDRRLEKAATVGAFRVQIKHSGAPWCYAGTYFWLKHSELFSRNWTEIEQTRYGVEGYPGRHFKFSESSALTVNSMPDHELPNWLYARNSMAGVTQAHLGRMLEHLQKEG
jgi:hypothetical protein